MLNCCAFLSIVFALQLSKKRREKSTLCPILPLQDKNDNDEADIETELQDPGVERAEEKQPEVESATEGKPEDLLVGETGFQSEGTEQEGDTDEDEESEAEGDTPAECETQTEDTCASTSTGPAGL